MWKVILLLVVALLPASLQAENVARLSTSMDLMKLCKADARQCELLLGIARDNIIFSAEIAAVVAGADKETMLENVLEVSAASCIKSVSTGQLRDLVLSWYGDINVANVGGQMMVFNALGIAATENCRT